MQKNKSGGVMGDTVVEGEVKEGLSEEVTSDKDLNKNKEPPM